MQDAGSTTCWELIGESGAMGRYVAARNLARLVAVKPTQI